MAIIELKMPKMGESITEATILKWLKEVGEVIEAEESILEIATDKIDSEVPAPIDGKLTEILFQEGDVVQVGSPIARIETEAEVPEGMEVPENGEKGDEEKAGEEIVPFVPSRVEEGLSAPSNQATKMPVSDRFYSPLVLNIAKQEGIGMQELEQVPGTGRKGRVTKKDILAYVENRGLREANGQKPVPISAQPIRTAPQIQEKRFSHSGNIEIEEMDRMRRMIAENMVYSKHISAHVTSFVEADVTSIVLWRNAAKADFQKTYNEKLTFTPIFVMAVAKALREMPRVNSSVDGNNILIKKEINIGVAVALPNDNLIVPVIRNADKMNLAGLSSAINDLASRARINKLKPEELEGGTYTVSNVGTFGNVMGTPIIMQPQVAILATGAIRKLPAVIETPQGDVIGIRHKMFLSHSYDHRIIDGALGGKFVKRVADHLESWDMNQGI